jgi:hypothetical protein
MSTATYYVLFGGVCITVLKELNAIVDEPYMVLQLKRTFTQIDSLHLQG